MGRDLVIPTSQCQGLHIGGKITVQIKFWFDSSWGFWQPNSLKLDLKNWQGILSQILGSIGFAVPRI